MKLKTAICGYGWVGKAMYELFPASCVYDPALKDLVIDGDESTDKVIIDNKNVVNDADIVFICVPTPSKKEGQLDTSIVQEIVSWCRAPLIVVRSTVNPGDCDKWEALFGRNIIMQPEYLGETVHHPLLDPKERPFLVIGGRPSDRRKLIELYTQVYNANVTIRQVSNLEAEVIKLSENRAIAFKVAECQELYDVCEKAKVDYYIVRDSVYGDDPRFNLWWTFIYPDNRGMNSKCIPKDVYAWCAWAESMNYPPIITRTILAKNKEWINDQTD